MRSSVVLLGSVAVGLVAVLLSVSLIAPPDEHAEPDSPAVTGPPASLASEPTLAPSSEPTHPAPAAPSPTMSGDTSAGSEGEHVGVAPPPPPPAERAALAEAVSEAVNDVVPGTEVGLAVYDQHNETMLANVNVDEQFYTASVVKLLIGIRALREGDWRIPDGQERGDLALMLSHSADWIAAALWDTHGGPAVIAEVSSSVPLNDTSPPNNPDQWETTRMSPRDVVNVYRYIDNDIPREAGRFMLDALAEAPEVAVDGFDQSFGIPSALPHRERAVKQGWMRIIDGLVLNTTGVVGTDGRYIVVLLTRQPGGTRFEDARQAVNAGIAALAPALRPGPRPGPHHPPLR